MAVLYRWTSLFRAYDLRLTSNRVILLLSAAGGALGFALGLVGSPDVWPAFGRAAVGVVTPFAAAAVAKELDPDHPLSAVLAAALGLPAVWVVVATPQSLLALLWLLLLLRFINRSTGLAPKVTDALAVLLFSGWLTWIGSPLFGVLGGAVLALDALLPSGRRAHAALGGATIIAAVAYWFDHANHYGPQPHDTWLGVVLLTTAVALIGVILSCTVVLMPGDATGRPLDSSRFQAAQIVALAVGLSFASWHGNAGATFFATLWAALVGAAIVHWVVAGARRSPVSL